MARTTIACLVSILLLAASPAPADAQWRVTSCGTTGQNLFVHDVLSDVYLWYTRLPDVDPAAYGSPEAYLEAVRYRPLDERFSYITSREANDAFFGESKYVGFGLSTALVGRELRVLQVFPKSPASEEGLARGDRITSIGGWPVSDLIARGMVDSAFGPAQAGVRVQIQYVTRSGARRSAALIKRIVAIPTVSLTGVYRAGGRRVGYLFFRNFVEPSFTALDNAFSDLVTSGIDDLVIDLRYNGGGLVSVARRLASLVGGSRTRGQVLAEYVHNDKNTRRNQVIRFEDAANAATLDRLVVITTPASASASELVINALRPFMPVIVIGDRTYGKPVGQYQVDFCDKVLAPVAFTLRNARGEGDYFGGFPPDCPAPDDVTRDLGDAAEGSLREALTYVATGACSAATPALGRLAAERVRAERSLGWQSVVNAY